MSKKPSTPLRVAPLRRVTAEPITDPAEQAAIDEMRRRRGKASLTVRARGSAKPAKDTRVSAVLKLARRLAAEDRPGFMAYVATQLSPDDQLELLEQTLVRLPADALHRLAEDLRGRLGKTSP